MIIKSFRNIETKNMTHSVSSRGTNLHDFGQNGFVEVVFKGGCCEVPLVHRVFLVLEGGCRWKG